MSNLMHKVKDAVAGHHHPEDKESTHDSSNVMHHTHGAHDASNIHTSHSDGVSTNHDPSMHDTAKTSITFDSTADNHPATGLSHNSMMATQKGTANTHGSTMGTTKIGSGGHSTGVIHDSKKGPIDVTPTAPGYTGGHTTGSHTHGSGNINAGPHDSKLVNKLDPRVDSDMDNRARNINVGPHQPNLANKLDPRVDSDLDNRGTHGGTQTSGSQLGDYVSTHNRTGTTSAPTAGVYTSNYGTRGDNSLGSHNSPAYNTRSTIHPTMGNTMDTRSEPGMTGQGAFGGTATGGSSYNAPETSNTSTSGPHSSKLLNKLDPRVDSSEHQSSITGNQRGF